MSTDDDDRPATLAGGAQRALRAARARAAASSDAAAGQAAAGQAAAGQAVPPRTTEPAADEADAGADPSAADTTTDETGADETTTDETAAAETTTDETAAVETTTDETAASADTERVRLSKTEKAPAKTKVARSKTDVVAATTSSDDEPPVVPTGRARAPKVKRESRRPVGTRPARRPVSRLTMVCSIVAIVALIFSVVSAVVWWRADHNDDRSAALARDDVAVSARLAVATVNTSDYRKPANALTNWLEVSTGTLHGQFSDSRASATKLLGQAKTVTSAIVLDAAVTGLDDGKGTATVIVSANVKRKPVTGAATTSRNRFRATMVRVGDEWKLDDLKILPPQLL